jgi:methionyl-tRNA formyltransferase
MGEIAAVEGDGFLVVCADGRFKVTRVQADGPKLAAHEFAANAGLGPGMRFS